MQTETIEYIFEAIDKSGVSLTDFSRLTNISRETLYRWKKGAAATDKLRVNLAYTVAVRFEKACRLEKLPLTDRLKAPQRLQALRRIISQMATK